MRPSCTAKVGRVVKLTVEGDAALQPASWIVLVSNVLYLKRYMFVFGGKLIQVHRFLKRCRTEMNVREDN